MPSLSQPIPPRTRPSQGMTSLTPEVHVSSQTLLFLFLHTPHIQLSNPVTLAPEQSVFSKIGQQQHFQIHMLFWDLVNPHQEVETIFSPLKLVTAS